MMQVTVIGGGIAGLATAFYLERKGKELGFPLRCTLLEAGPRPGGKIVTDRRDGFVIEGGPDSFITQKPWGLNLCRDLGLEDQLIPCNEARQCVYLVRDGRLVLMPAGYRLAVPTKWGPFIRTPLLSLLGKLRVAGDLTIPARTDRADESIGDFVRRRFGPEALEAMAGPMMAGIHVADHDRLSLHATFPMFAEIEHKYGSVIRGMMKARKAARGRPPPPALFMSFKGGMQVLVDELQRQMTAEVRTGCRVLSIHRAEQGYTVYTDPAGALATDAVMIAAPADAAAELLAPHDEELAHGLRNIRSVSTAVLSLGYRREDLRDVPPLDGFGFIVPKTERRSILACTWSSTKFAHRAPDGHVLMRVFVGGDLQEALAEQSEPDIVSMVRRELAELMNLRAEPVVRSFFRWPRGNPQYDVGHLDRVTRLEERVARLPNICLVGSSYRGIGIPDCVESAVRATDRLLDELRSAPSRT